MSRFFSTKYSSLTPYTPGEQPTGRAYIKLNTNESPYPPAPLVTKMAAEAAENLQLYPDPTCADLVARAAEQLGLAKEELLFTNGSDEILHFAFMAFCDAEHPAVFPDITYGFYRVFAELNGVPFRELPLKEDFTVDTAAFSPANGTVFLANPNAPTGIPLSRAEVEGIIAANPDNVVVVDEAYVDFGGESVLPLIKKYDNLLVCRTFSKSRSLAGARLGFGAACPALIRDLNAIKYSTNPYNINRMTMAAGIGSLSDEWYFKKTLQMVTAERERAAEGLVKLGFTCLPSKANFLFIRHPSLDGKQLYLALKEKGVLVRHFDTPRLRDYNRVSIGSREQMNGFFAALTAILEENRV